MAAQKRFFVETLGGNLATIGTNNLEVIEFPNVFLFFRPMQAADGRHDRQHGESRRLLGAGLEARRGEAQGERLQDDHERLGRRDRQSHRRHRGREPHDEHRVRRSGPEETKVELVEVKTQTAPIQLHHVHFFGEQQAEMQAWYAKVFGAAAQPAESSSGVRHRSAAGRDLELHAVADGDGGHAGRALDHIGFEVKNLEAFTKKLEADGIPLTVSYRTCRRSTSRSPSSRTPGARTSSSPKGSRKSSNERSTTAGERVSRRR